MPETTAAPVAVEPAPAAEKVPATLANVEAKGEPAAKGGDGKGNEASPPPRASEAAPGAKETPSAVEKPAAPESDSDPSYDIEIGGKKHSVSLSELKETFVHAVSSYEEVRTAKALAEETEKFFSNASRDPMSAMVDLYEDGGMARGQAFEQVLRAAGKMVSDWWEFQQKPEAERKALSLEDRLNHMERERQQLLTERQQRQREEAEFEAAKILSSWITPALKAAELSATEATIEELGKRLHEVKERGFEVTEKTVVRIARNLKRELDSQSQEFETKRLKNLDIETLLGLRPDLEEAFTKRTLEKVAAKNSERIQTKAPGAPREEPRKKMVYQDLGDIFRT